MSLNDPLANVLSHIDTYERLGKNTAFTKSTSKVIQKVLRIMQDYGYLGSFEEIIDRKGNFLKINLIGGINKTNVIKPHFKVKNDEMVKFEKRFLPAKDFGLFRGDDL